jgi:hypothetical protein
VVRTGARRRVEGEAIERSAQRLVVRERARRRRREAAEPLRPSGRLSSGDGGGAERCLRLVVFIDLVLDLEEPVPPEVTEHALDGVREHLTDRAGRKMTELVPWSQPRWPQGVETARRGPRGDGAISRAIEPTYRAHRPWQRHGGRRATLLHRNARLGRRDQLDGGASPSSCG